VAGAWRPPQGRRRGERFGVVSGRSAVKELLEALRERRTGIVRRWHDLVLETYPAQSTGFLKAEKDRFRNPVGGTLQRDLEALFDGLLGDDPSSAPLVPLDNIVRVRAVQNFSPGRAVGFLLLLKRAVADEMTVMGHEVGAEEMLAFHARVDELLLRGVDVLVSCRERVFEIRAREARTRVHSLLRRAGLLEEAEAAGGEDGVKGGNGA
jgi:hypothetical protein